MFGAHDDVAPGGFPRRRERRQRRGGGGVLDVSVPAAGQAEQLCSPVERQGLELGRRRRCPPQERDRVERRRKQLGQDPGFTGAGREVGEEARALPVRDPGQKDLVEVTQDVGKRLAALGRRRRQARTDIARLDLRQHRQLADTVEVLRRPLERGGAVFPERHRRVLRR